MFTHHEAFNKLKRNEMIAINQVVINKKGQKGTITRIITKSTGYVEVSFEDGSIKKRWRSISQMKTAYP